MRKDTYTHPIANNGSNSSLAFLPIWSLHTMTLGRTANIKSEMTLNELYKKPSPITTLMLTHFPPGRYLSQKYGIGLHWNIVTRKKTRPDMAEATMAI
jgi:hypothetical protein